MLKEKIATFIEKIRAIDGVAACALVSRDGIIAGKSFDREINEPWFGALTATILASAESAGSIIRMKSPESVTIRAPACSIVVMGGGEKFLVAAIVKGTADNEKVYRQMLEVAQKIDQVL